MHATATKLAVICRNVVKTYGTNGNTVVALRGIDIDVPTAELMMLVGPSGCGKTTLISVIAGILDQDSGTCEVFGQDLLHMKARAKTRFRGQAVGFVFQQFNLIPSLTAAEMEAVGVKRLSVGGALSRLALAAFMNGARDMRERGGFTWVREAIPTGDLKIVFRA